MPRYHFHVHSAVEAHDDEGQEFLDLDAAKVSAVAGVRALVVEEMMQKHRFSPNHSIRITDPAGQSLFIVRYGDCVDVRF